MLLKPKYRPIQVNAPHEAMPLSIVADGAIATEALGEGRLIPLIIVDAHNRADIVEIVRIHQHTGQGDVGAQWVQIEGRPGTVSLVLRFIRPAEATAIVEFDLGQNQGVLVDQILSANGLYLQCGVEGDRLRDDVQRPKLVIEVPDTGFKKDWDRIYKRHWVERLKASGRSRAECRRLANEAIAKLRELNRFRMRVKPLPGTS